MSTAWPGDNHTDRNTDDAADVQHEYRCDDHGVSG
jgi:hypothetical protein